MNGLNDSETLMQCASFTFKLIVSNLTITPLLWSCHERELIVELSACSFPSILLFDKQ